MSRLNDTLLHSLCGKKETLQKAQSLLRLATVKTAPGSGYSLGGDASGLPAICAYIASIELGNGDVSEKVAQTASCLQSTNFRSAMNVVRSALAADEDEDEDGGEGESESLTYRDLLEECRIGRPGFVTECIMLVEKALIASQHLSRELRLPYDATTLAVFSWTCRNALKMKQKVDPEVLVKKYAVAVGHFNDVTDILETSCEGVKSKIEAKVAALRAAVKTPADGRASSTTTPAVSPTKSPSKPALKGSVESSPMKHKRKVAFHDIATPEDLGLLETPSKRRRVSPRKGEQSILELPTPRGPLERPAPTRPGLFPSSKSSFNPQEAAPEPSETMSASLSERLSNVIEPSVPVAGPSTPRRRATQALQTPTSSRTALSGLQTPQSATRLRKQPTQRFDADEPRRPRFRPVYLEQRQWMERDPRAERDWRIAEEFMKSLTLTHGEGVSG